VVGIPLGPMKAVPVDIPANCPGVLAVAGLRNIGTKVGYSSLGPGGRHRRTRRQTA